MKNPQTPKIQIGCFHPLSLLDLSKLCIRIQKNEGYCNRPYKDRLGKSTIGYGHLIKKHERHLFKKSQSKHFLIKLFLKDLNIAIINFEKYYDVKKIPDRVQEVIIEMIFQLGIKNVLNFKKFNKHIKMNQFFMAALEMIDSRWYKQTPKRVNLSIDAMLNHSND